MTKDEIPNTPAGIYALQQPEKLSNVLAEEQPEDCLACRLTELAASTRDDFEERVEVWHEVETNGNHGTGGDAGWCGAV
ncbi:hypothetical protein MMC10_003154 [Thelotrema lepadinum]|nr:hypothetical protein [Thelotrema lepadinum]